MCTVFRQESGLTPSEASRPASKPKDLPVFIAGWPREFWQYQAPFLIAKSRFGTDLVNICCNKFPLVVKSEVNAIKAPSWVQIHQIWCNCNKCFLWKSLSGLAGPSIAWVPHVPGNPSNLKKTLLEPFNSGRYMYNCSFGSHKILYLKVQEPYLKDS